LNLNLSKFIPHLMPSMPKVSLYLCALHVYSYLLPSRCYYVSQPPLVNNSYSKLYLDTDIFVLKAEPKILLWLDVSVANTLKTENSHKIQIVKKLTMRDCNPR
jgi:hypothetical protein